MGHYRPHLNLSSICLLIFIQKLYTSQGPSSSNVCDFLTNNHLSLKKLSDEHKKSPDSPITSSEVLATIWSLEINKAPKWDGVPLEFYKKFGDLLADPLSKVFSSILSNGIVPESWNYTKIVVTPKKDVDFINPKAYHPIALLNNYLNIFTSILAKRLSSFIPHRVMSDNIRKVLNLIQFCRNKCVDFSLLLSLDPEKAFDSVEIPYLLSLIKQPEAQLFFLLTLLFLEALDKGACYPLFYLR